MSQTITNVAPGEVRFEPCGFLLVLSGLIGLAGCVAVVVGNVIGSILVPGHDWIADTISDLGAGRWEIVQDVALYGYAAAHMAAALGAANAHPGGLRWSAGILCLGLLAAVIVVVGARNEYGDRDAEGIVIHSYLVYALGILYAAGPMLMAQGMGRLASRAAWVAVGCAVLWGIGAPIFFFLPTGIDGIWERGLGLITIVWVATLSWLLFRVGRRLGRG